MTCALCHEPVLPTEVVVDATQSPWLLADAVGATHLECADDALTLALDGEASLDLDFNSTRGC